MNEHNVLELLSGYADQQFGLLAQLISLHLVMVAGIYYFLHRSGLIMKLAVHALYSLGYATLGGLLYNVSNNVVAARVHLEALAQLGPVSPITQTVLSRDAWSGWAAIAGNTCLVALWLGTTAFLFFWKRPAER